MLKGGRIGRPFFQGAAVKKLLNSSAVRSGISSGKEMAGIEWPATDIEGAFSMTRWGP
jgi:hypothetical protein